MMQVIGVIGEYNPFHNGHIFHLDTIKNLYPDSLIILVVNGYFLQRGELSILTKEAKTLIALNNNVDLVIELPFIYGTQSADIFAKASITILEKLKCDYIIAGSESNNLAKIAQISKKQLNDKSYNEMVKSYLAEGLNYPTSLAKALNLKFNFLPNDLLNISYFKTILENNYRIQLKTIKRTSDYHDIKSNEKIVSASNIREKIKNNIDISKYLPKMSINKLITLNYTNYFKLLKYKILTCPNLNIYLDVDEGIEYRLKKYINEVNSLEELIKKVKTKRYTFNKINRMFIHLLIGLKKIDNQDKNYDYLKILGFNLKGKKYLQAIKKETNISFKIAANDIIRQYELQASQIYDLINGTNTYQFELKNKPLIKKD